MVDCKKRPLVVVLAAIVIVIALMIAAHGIPGRPGTFHGTVPSYLKH